MLNNSIPVTNTVRLSYKNRMKLVEVDGLIKHFPLKGSTFKKSKAFLKAVDGVSFAVYKNETFGLVGESGCGKTTLGLLILRLIKPTDGKVIFNGENIYNISLKKMRNLRKEMQIVFQDPFGSLNPRMSVGRIISEPFIIHQTLRGSEINKKVKNLLETVGLPKDYINRYPHEFSGGQRQRICIARALALNPKLIVCDEPVSALDVAVQSQILNLLSDIQRARELTYVFISHDLAVVRHISHRVGVMYLGKIVEIAESEEIYHNSLHPYTKALISAIPVPDPRHKTSRIILEGDVPSPTNTPRGCNFQTRCWKVKPICKIQDPKLFDTGRKHFVACHLYNNS